MRISQNQVRPNKSNWPLSYPNSYNSTMSDIATAFNVNLTFYTRKHFSNIIENGYLVTIKSKDSRNRLIEYLVSDKV